jgi:hypothetical protein
MPLFPKLSLRKNNLSTWLLSQRLQASYLIFIAVFSFYSSPDFVQVSMSAPQWKLIGLNESAHGVILAAVADTGMN